MDLTADEKRERRRIKDSGRLGMADGELLQGFSIDARATKSEKQKT